MLYNIKFSKVQGGAAVRTDEVIGSTNHLPVLNSPFSLLGKSLTEGGSFRLVSTSPVVEIQEVNENTSLLVTASGSVYKVEILDEHEILN